MLGLDVLDAVIEGLHSSRNVRSVRGVVPEYAEMERLLEESNSKNEEHQATLAKSLEEAAQLRANVQLALETLTASVVSLAAAAPADVRAVLVAVEEERQLVSLLGHRRDLTILRKRVVPIDSAANATAQRTAEVDQSATSVAVDMWWSSVGKRLEILVDACRDVFPDVPSVASTSPQVAYKTALDRVVVELERCGQILATDDALVLRLEQVAQLSGQSRARIAMIDEQIGRITINADGLGQALAQLVPHIHNDECPVCGRDHREVADTPLIQVVSAQIARLAEQANQIQGLGRARIAAVNDLAKAEQEDQAASLRRLDQSARVALKARISGLSETRNRLSEMSALVEPGEVAIRRDSEARRRLAQLRNADRVEADLRLAIDEMCTALGQAPIGPAEALGDAMTRLEQFVAAQEQALLQRQRLRREALAQYDVWLKHESAIGRMIKSAESDDIVRKRRAAALGEAQRRLHVARNLSKTATNVRTDIVGRVFNRALNKIWRDLFVRLAPGEAYVPAFQIPSAASRDIVAQLETIHRDGGSGGAPGVMLSAGNLNTAALTLFLALHLSVKPHLPWLILDDPVQSMDEVHIAQFAALLRTLSKEHGRKVLIAVHERPLFDYLALELSPAFRGDQLVTVELSHAYDGRSIAEPTFHNWEPDRAVAA